MKYRSTDLATPKTSPVDLHSNFTLEGTGPRSTECRPPTMRITHSCKRVFELGSALSGAAFSRSVTFHSGPQPAASGSALAPRFQEIRAACGCVILAELASTV